MNLSKMSVLVVARCEGLDKNLVIKKEAIVEHIFKLGQKLENVISVYSQIHHKHTYYSTLQNIGTVKCTSHLTHISTVKKHCQEETKKRN